MPHELIENKKIVLLKYCLLLLYTTIANHFSIRLWLVTERDFMQPVVSSSVLGPRRSFKAIPKAKLAPQEGHGHCFMVCCRWDPLQLSESLQNHYIWEVCLANRWNAPKSTVPATSIGQQMLGPARAQFYCMTTPDCMLHSQCSKSWMNWATKFRFICHIHLTSCQLTTTSSSILTIFLQKRCFHKQQDIEHAFWEFFKSQSTDFYATWINKLISRWQKCADYNGSYFD